jgi:hypothetical protein
VNISWLVTGAALAGALVAGDARAQTPRGVAVEGVAGWAGFVDDATIHHSVIGASVRVPILDRLSVGPEVVYMVGPGDDRDLFLLGSIWFDFVPTTPRTIVVPYLVAGGGYMRHRDVFRTGVFASGEGSFTAGGGARVHLNDRVYVGGDVRIGWELHLRTTAHVGFTWPPR